MEEALLKLIAAFLELECEDSFLSGVYDVQEAGMSFRPTARFDDPGMKHSYMVGTYIGAALYTANESSWWLNSADDDSNSDSKPRSTMEIPDGTEAPLCPTCQDNSTAEWVNGNRWYCSFCDDDFVEEITDPVQTFDDEVYCLSCASENVEYLAAMANGEEYRCNDCQCEFSVPYPVTEEAEE